MKKPINKIAILHDMCGIGKAALTNVMPVLSIMGIECCPIPTLILSTHTGGFGKPVIRYDVEFIEDSINHYKENNISFDGIFIGYLGSREILRSSKKFINSFNKPKIILFDPICGDSGKLYSNFNEDYVKDLKDLIKLSDIITPNFTEACLLTNKQIKTTVTLEEIEEIAKDLVKLGAKNVIITSLPAKEGEIGIAIYRSDLDKLSIISHKKEKKSYPGTGDIFAAVLLGNIINGLSVEMSVEKASKFVLDCVRESNKYDYPTKEGVLLEKCLHKILN